MWNAFLFYMIPIKHQSHNSALLLLSVLLQLSLCASVWICDTLQTWSWGSFNWWRKTIALLAHSRVRIRRNPRTDEMLGLYGRLLGQTIGTAAAPMKPVLLCLITAAQDPAPDGWSYAEGDFCPLSGVRSLFCTVNSPDSCCQTQLPSSQFHTPSVNRYWWKSKGKKVVSITRRSAAWIWEEQLDHRGSYLHKKYSNR